MAHSLTPAIRKPQSGVTLVELLVAMGISVVLLTAASLLFTESHKHQAELDKTNRLIDNGRYALDLLASNLSHAGYYGEYAPTGLPGSAIDPPDPCSTTFTSNDLEMHVQGVDAPSLLVAPTKPSCIPATETLAAGSDILVIRRVSTTPTVLTAISGSSTWYVQSSLCKDDTAKVKVAKVAADMTLRKQDCSTLAQPRQLVVELYFVSANNTGNDGVPTLKKVELQADGTFSGAIPLVEGIEHLQLAYGQDAPEATDTPDGAPDSFIACSSTDACKEKNWSSAVSVKIWLVARNLEKTNGLTDTKTYDLGLGGTLTPPTAAQAYRRQIFMRTVRLINPAERRES